MNRCVVALFAVCFLLLPGLGLAESVSFRVQPHAEGRFELIVEKTRLMAGKQHLFVFPEYEGKLSFDAEAPESAAIELRVRTATVVCKDDWVSDKDLAKIEAEARDKMMQAAKYPELLFRSHSVRTLPENVYEVSGDLSIRGAARPVKVKVTMRPMGDGGLRFEGESSINMTDWGLKPPSAALGTVGTSELMQVRFQLFAEREVD